MSLLNASIAMLVASPAVFGAKVNSHASAVDLCKSLSQIKHVPFKNEPVPDPVYNQIMAKGQAAVPCLIDQINNQTRMADPRTEPVVRNFRVGDLAYFLALHITGVPFEDTLPDNVRAKFDNDGVYAYFDYVETPANRLALQKWWKSWLKANRHPPP